jgi:hypothetical protein
MPTLDCEIRVVELGDSEYVITGDEVVRCSHAEDTYQLVNHRFRRLSCAHPD